MANKTNKLLTGAPEKGVCYKVAVYGTLMTGERNARWREGVKTLTMGTMKGALLDTGHCFPAFVPDEKNGIDVKCEVLFCDADQLARMDRLEGYPRLYRRELVKVINAKTGRPLTALVYVMNRIDPSFTVIESGDWPKYRKEMRL